MNGVCYPFSGWVIGTLTDVMLDPTRTDFLEKVDRLSLFFFLIGIGQLLTLTFQFFFLSKVAETLTFSVRIDMMKKILKMPISWFDKPENTPGALGHKLSQDC